MSERLSTVRLINDRGRVVCDFQWTDTFAGEPFWRVAPKRSSQKSKRRAEEAALKRFPGASPDELAGLASLEMSAHESRLPEDNLLEYENDELVRIHLPSGPTLRWEKVTVVLDKLAEAFPDKRYLEMSVNHFRQCFR